MKLLDRARRKSPWILHYNAGSCNGCDIEIWSTLTPMYDVERFGIVNVGNPKHADILVVTGPVNQRNMRVLRNLYDQILEPKAVVAVGICAASGGVFAGCYNCLGGVDKVIPVDVYVPGCACKPEMIMQGVLMAAERLNENRTALQGAAPESLADPNAAPCDLASGDVPTDGDSGTEAPINEEKSP